MTKFLCIGGIFALLIGIILFGTCVSAVRNNTNLKIEGAVKNRIYIALGIVILGLFMLVATALLQFK